MEYKGIVRQRPGYFVPLAITICVLIILRDIILSHLSYAPIAAIVIIACFFKKDYTINEGGIDLVYTLFKMRTVNHWEWRDITSFPVDKKRAYAKVMLHIGKDSATRTYTMEPGDVDGIIRLAKSKNSKIYIKKQV